MSLSNDFVERARTHPRSQRLWHRPLEQRAGATVTA
jgi:hypothetical protein